MTRPRHLAALAAALLSLAGPAAPQQADPAMTALTPASDAVIARRLLMSAIGANNDAVHDMLDGVIDYDAYELESRLAAMSAMLRAFPSLYRAEPNPYSPEAEAADPFTVSLATQAVWDDWPRFQALSYDAWQTALDASVAPRDDVLGLVEALEVQCESCHDAYRIEFEYFDFDSLPPAQPD